MKETARIRKLFEELYNGDPWIAVTITGTLKDISAEQAAKKVVPTWNSIWQIVNHLIGWRENVLLRLHGEVIVSPANNYIDDITDASENAWTDTLHRLQDSQQKWVSFLDQFDEVDFEKIYPANNGSYYKHIHGIIQHDAYHLGQVVLLAKGL
ncbi:MAG: DinB family protein [Ferruginibacter sp.]